MYPVDDLLIEAHEDNPDRRSSPSPVLDGIGEVIGTLGMLAVGVVLCTAEAAWKAAPKAARTAGEALESIANMIEKK